MVGLTSAPSRPVQCLSHRLYEWSGPENSNRVFFPHQRSGDESPDVSPTSPECTPEGEVLMPAAIGHMSPSHRLGEDPDKDTVDLVYWASRLAEKGAGMTSWARGPDLPSLVADIRMLRAAV